MKKNKSYGISIKIKYDYFPQSSYPFEAWSTFYDKKLLGTSNKSFEHAKEELIKKVKALSKMPTPPIPEIITVKI